MKPFPEAVQEAFPCAQDRVAERPWWSTTFYKSVRCDGPEVAPDKIARIDAEHPLPHPGYRAGQVWAAEDGSSTVVAEVRMYPDGFSLWTGDGAYWQKAERYHASYPYLLADPACPHLAPWSPLGETT